MSVFRRRFSFIFILILIAVFTLVPIAEARDTFYIVPSQVSLSLIMPPPPPADSQAQKDDLKAVQDAQKNRTEAQVKSALADNLLTIFDFVSNVLGPDFRKEKLPVATGFFENVFRDQIEVCLEIKEHYNRKRPFVVDPEIKPVYNQQANPSYPSGHATTGYVYAAILSMMVPEKAYAIFERASVYGRNRVISGVHFPTDVEAGKTSAAAIANALVQQPLFMRDFDRAKKEVRQALGLK
jgi:acid phosphatase (class A)